MSAYERRAWNEVTRRVASQRHRRLPIPDRVRELGRSATEKMSDFANDHAKVEKAQRLAEDAMKGTFELTFRPAMQTASLQKVMAGYHSDFAHVGAPEDLLSLDLRDLDGFRRRKGTWVTTAALQGSVTALAITGSEVSTTVSAGTTAGVTVGAVVADTVGTLALMGRSIGDVAARYGHDVRLPDEEVYAMSVLSLGMAESEAARVAAYAALARLTQQMMRRATWKQLEEHMLVRVLKIVYLKLGLKLTQRKLAQIVPVVGVGIGAALSASIVSATYTRAEDVYRLRFLAEKYDVDLADWLESLVIDAPVVAEDDDAIDIVEITDEELGQADA